MVQDDDDEGPRPAGGSLQLVVDAANTVGARPDGWWRDRAGAAQRLLGQLSRLARVREVAAPDGLGGAGSTDGRGGWVLEVSAVHAVLEGRARSASPGGLQDGVHVHLAPADGDAAIAALAQRLTAEGGAVLVVTADRGLRARLPRAALTAGPGWLREQLDRLEREG